MAPPRLGPSGLPVPGSEARAPGRARRVERARRAGSAGARARVRRRCSEGRGKAEKPAAGLVLVHTARRAASLSRVCCRRRNGSAGGDHLPGRR